MYTIEEFDKQKTRILKYILYKKMNRTRNKNKIRQRTRWRPIRRHYTIPKRSRIYKW